MRRQLHPFLLLLLLAVLPLSAIADGEWNPIRDVHDPHVMEIAKFAVSTFNRKHGTHLILKDIRSGETQADRGIKYFLHLLLAQPSSPCYVALVLEKRGQKSLELSSFEGDTC